MTDAELRAKLTCIFDFEILNELDTEGNFVCGHIGFTTTDCLWDTRKWCLMCLSFQLDDLDKLSVIHVSGTKGKGSTCAYCESILRSHGFKTGFFRLEHSPLDLPWSHTMSFGAPSDLSNNCCRVILLSTFSSPHLVEVRERIRINGEPLSHELFSQYFWHCYNQLEMTKVPQSYSFFDCTHFCHTGQLLFFSPQKFDEGSMPPYFRFLTILAFHVFIQEKVLPLPMLSWFSFLSGCVFTHGSFFFTGRCCHFGSGHWRRVWLYQCCQVEVSLPSRFTSSMPACVTDKIILFVWFSRSPVVCGVSSLGLDHTSILGDTIDKIAWHKGGIFKVRIPLYLFTLSLNISYIIMNSLWGSSVNTTSTFIPYSGLALGLKSC